VLFERFVAHERPELSYDLPQYFLCFGREIRAHTAEKAKVKFGRLW
jgi:hypothetical protein